MNKNIRSLIEDYLAFRPDDLELVDELPKRAYRQDTIDLAYKMSPKDKYELKSLILELIRGMRNTHGPDCRVLDLSMIDTSKITDMSYLFKDIFTKHKKFIFEIDFTGWDTSNVTNMEEMFSRCSNLRILDLSMFDTSKVTNMKKMFSRCKGLLEVNVSSFNTSNVETMYDMFYGCETLSSIDVSHFYIKKAAHLTGMFLNCNGLNKIELFEIPMYSYPPGLDKKEYYNTYYIDHALKGVNREILLHMKNYPKWVSDYYMTVTS